MSYISTSNYGGHNGWNLPYRLIIIRYFDKSVLILNTNELKYKATTDHNLFLHQEQAEMQCVRTIINKQGGGGVNSLI